MIDSHTHIDGPEYDADRDAVVARAHAAGVTTMVAVGTDLESSRRAVALAQTVAGVVATIGVHPHESKTLTPETIESLRQLGARPKVVACGETGLDYHYMYSPREAQQQAFRAQIRLARQLDRPLVLHTRDAWDDTFAILAEEDAAAVGGVFHCFTGDRVQAQRALALGFDLSLSGVLTFPKALELREVARTTPLDRLLIETDCPYLTPVPYRGQRNEPAFVARVAEQIATVKEIPVAEVAAATTANTRRRFRL